MLKKNSNRSNKDIEDKKMDKHFLDLISDIQQCIFKKPKNNSEFPKYMEEELENIIVKSKGKYTFKLLKETFSKRRMNICSEIFQRDLATDDEKFDVILKILKENIEHFYVLEYNRKQKSQKMIRSDDENEDEFSLFDFCCKTITTDILGYEITHTDEKDIYNVPKYLALRIKGFHTGEFVTNYSRKQPKKKTGYSYDVIKATIVINKNKIIKALKGKTFIDEKAKINYICAIIENNLNNTKLRFEQIKQTKEKTEIEMEKNKSLFEREYTCVWNDDNYIKKSKDKKNIDEFW